MLKHVGSFLLHLGWSGMVSALCGMASRCVEFGTTCISLDSIRES